MRKKLQRLIVPSNMVYVIIGTVLLSIGIVFFNEERKKKFKKIFSDPILLVALILSIIWSYLTLSLPPNTRYNIQLRNATKSAIVGFIITIMSAIGMYAGPFWVLWIVSYYLHM